MIPARIRTPTSANEHDPPQDPARSEKEFTIPFALPRDPWVKHSQSLYDPAQRHPTRVRSPHDTAHPPLQMDTTPPGSRTIPRRCLRSPSRSRVIPRRNTPNPITIWHNGILQRYCARTIPHTHLCKWVRSPSGSRKIPSRCACDPFTIPCDPEEKHSQSPHVPAQRYPTRA